MRLYEIVDEVLLAYQEIDEENSTGKELLEHWQAEFTYKLENCAKVVRNLMAQEEALRNEGQRLLGRAQTAKRRAQGLKEYVQNQMERVGLKKTKAGLFSFNIQKSPMRIEIIDEGLVPKDFWSRTQVIFDKKGIGEHVKETGEIPEGVSIHQGTHLRIS